MAGGGEGKATSGGEHATDLREPARRVGHVLDHLAGPDEIKGVIAERERSVERDAHEIQAGVPAPGPTEGRLGHLGAGDSGRTGPIGQRGEITLAATQIQNAIAGSEEGEEKLASQLEVRGLETLREARPELLVVLAHARQATGSPRAGVPRLPRAGGPHLASTAVRAGSTIASRLRQLAGSPSGRAVLVVFGAGIALRVAFLALYRPAFLGITDAGSYITAAHRGLFDNVYDPAGYPLFIRTVHAVYAHLSLLILIQHALGVGSAALLYLAVRRLTGSRVAALVPAGIVLLDGYGLWVEHTPISETLFGFLIIAALVLALYAARRGHWLLLADGVLIGLAGVVRPVGLILIPIIAVWLVAGRAGGARARCLAAGAVVLPAVVLVAGYVAIQRADTGFTGLTRDSGRVLYARAAMFADCSKFTPPAGTAALCERTPSSRRGSFNQYLTGFPDHAAGVSAAGRSISPAWRVFGPPPGGDGKLAAFGLAAIVHQPLDYLAHVADDFHYYWADHHRAFFAAAARVDPGVRAAVSAYYPADTGVHAAGVGFLSWYGRWIEITGVLTIALLLASLTGPFARDPGVRSAAVLLASVGWLLPLLSDATASVDPRFILPAYGPLAASAALGLSGRRRGGHGLGPLWLRRRRGLRVLAGHRDRDPTLADGQRLVDTRGRSIGHVQANRLRQRLTQLI